MQPNSAQARSLDLATERYHAALDDQALAYLSERGISQEIADGFRLGLAADPVVGHEFARGRLALPYLTRGGVKSIKFRCLAGHDCGEAGCPKYLAVSGTRPRLYNVEALFSPGSVIAVCEGEFDAIVTHSLCDIPAVSVPGVSSWLPHFPRVFEGFDQVFVLADNDEKEEGRNPGAELAARISKDLAQAVVVQPPKGLDMTTWYLKEGRDAIRKACGL